MVKIIMHGCNGKMGQVISGLIAADPDMELVAGIDARDDGHNPYPVFTDITKCDVAADAIIDFSAAVAVDKLLDYCVEKKLPCVLCTTGLSEAQLAKVDAPSGTALALADSINEEFNGEYEYVYDRSNRREQRPKKEIGISSVRGGTIVGDHDVIFAGADEVVTFSHTAYSKAVFGKGAVQAAKFLAGKPAGMYNMSDVINAAM